MSNVYTFDFLVDALTCYSCGVLFTTSVYHESALCQGFNETTPTMECTNSTYCLSKYAHIEEPILWDGQEYHNLWAHSCAQHLFEDDLLGMWYELIFLPDPIDSFPLKVMTLIFAKTRETDASSKTIMIMNMMRILITVRQIFTTAAVTLTCKSTKS